MNYPHYLISRMRLLVFSTLFIVTCAVLTISQKGLASQDTSAQLSSLQLIRNMVEKNETSTKLIKMNYTVKFNWNDNRLPEASTERNLTTSGNLVGDNSYNYRNGTWAQDGIKKHLDIDSFNYQDKLLRGQVSVIDGEVMKLGVKPDFMLGSIDYIDNYGWTGVAPVRLGSRPFDGRLLLSKYLVSEYASVHDETEMVDGRETYVVDLKRQGKYVYYGRAWMDKERGVPLRFEYYDNPPTSEEPRLRSRTESIKLHQLPNGGWLPVEGTRVTFFRGAAKRVLSKHTIVDVSSITTVPDDIPGSLFTITFPEKANVYNAILGVTLGPGGKVGRIADRTLANLLTSDGTPETTTRDSDETAATRSVQKTPNLPSTVNPEQSTTKDTSIPLDSSPTNYHSFAMVWVFLSVLLITLILTVIAWIIRNHGIANRGDTK